MQICHKNDLLKKKKVKKSKITANNTEIQKEEIMEDTQNKSNEPTPKIVSSRNKVIDRKLSHSDTLHGFMTTLNPEKLVMQTQTQI